MYEILVVIEKRVAYFVDYKNFNVICWNCMQEITKLKTILKGFIKSFATQAKRKN